MKITRLASANLWMISRASWISILETFLDQAVGEEVEDEAVLEEKRPLHLKT